MNQCQCAEQFDILRYLWFAARSMMSVPPGLGLEAELSLGLSHKWSMACFGEGLAGVCDVYSKM